MGCHMSPPCPQVFPSVPRLTVLAVGTGVALRAEAGVALAGATVQAGVVVQAAVLLPLAAWPWGEGR